MLKNVYFYHLATNRIIEKFDTLNPLPEVGKTITFNGMSESFTVVRIVQEQDKDQHVCQLYLRPIK